MKTLVCSLILVGILTSAYTQEVALLNNDSTDYYYKIPDYPESYTAGNVAARVVDGLGFRYYWATQGLRDVDLAFQPSESARTSGQTLDHIFSLTLITYNAIVGSSNTDNPNTEQWSFDKKRAHTLENIKKVSELLKNSSEEEMENFIAVLGQGDKTTEYPFWNMLNGPIADALWHVGQIITFRRSSGNPLNSNASMLRGRLRN